MENASKALLIAGAILIVILLIAVGMIVYNNSKSTIDAGIAQMDSTEIQMFNSQFTNYEGKQSGTAAKALVETILANNATYANDSSKKVNVSWGSAQLMTQNSAEMQTYLINDYIVQSQNYYITLLKNSSGLVKRVIIQSEGDKGYKYKEINLDN